MDLTDYRRDFARFSSEWELIRFADRHSDTITQKIERLAERSGHLFERATILALIELARVTAHISETESTGRRLLSGAAVDHYLEIVTRDHRRECRACALATRIAWRDERLGASMAPQAIAREADRDQRSELCRRWQSAMRHCAEPRLELLEARRNALKDLGFQSSAELWTATRRVDLDRLERAAAGFLQQTETAYFHGLAELRARNPELRHLELDISDQLRWRCLARFDRLFPSVEMVGALRIALSWMGIDVDRQQNLRIDLEPESRNATRTELFPIQPPADVRMIVAPLNGASGYTAMFDVGGQAQHAAWTSPTYFERAPEFIYSPDRATPLAFGRLFVHLHLDKAWVAELYLAGTEGGADEVVAEFALLALHDMRENCAKLSFWRARDAAGDLSSEGAGVEYAARMRDATGFVRDGLNFLADSGEEYPVTDAVRAVMFESMFLEHLRSNYGSRWWAERKAADELRDIWNTGSRYSVEELAAMFGLGELSFDAGADRLTALVK